ncbi:MAG: toluene hydroxylase [Mycobacterium sp.]|nr:toluene hydroxylase [Mycobacterium sp.]
MTTTESAGTEHLRNPRPFLNPAYDIDRTPLDTQRTNQYYATPFRKRISEYEMLMLYAQPGPDWIPGGLNTGGFCNNYSGGRQMWENYGTEAKTIDWFAFRDPNARNTPEFALQKAQENEAAINTMTAYADQGMYKDMDEEWALEILPTYFGALAHDQYGVFGSLLAPARDVLSDVLRGAVILCAFDHLDNAETIQAEKVFLSKNIQGFEADVAPAKQCWMSDPVYGKDRAVVERLWGDTWDNIEVPFALLMIHEPLFGRFSRQQFFHRLAPLHGDQLTPAMLWSNIVAIEMDGKWAMELFGRCLGQDPKYGDYNRKLMRLWARDWLAESVAAMRDFAPMFGRTHVLHAAGGQGAAEDAAYAVISDWARRYAPLFGLEVDVDDLVKTVRSGYRSTK